MDERRRTSVLASVLFAVVLLEVATAAVAVVVAGSESEQLLGDLTNTVIGLSLGVAGWPIARHRPGNPLGWLLLAGGVCYSLSGAGYPLIAAATSPGEDAPGWRVVATLTNGGWPWAVGLFIPLVLLLFPDGRLPGPRWRWLVVVIGVAAALFVSLAVFPEETYAGELGVAGYLRWPAFDAFTAAGPIAPALGGIAYIGVLVSLVVRYRRGDERTRRQLLWLLLATTTMVACFVVSDYLGLGSDLLVLAITLVPLSIMVAVLRDQLLDIRLVVSRSLLYLLLTAGVIGVYAGLVAALDGLVRRQVGATSAVIATLVIAFAFNPVRLWLQRRLDVVFFGARRDPVRAMAEVGARLGEVDSEAPSGLAGVLEALCRVLRLPSASIVVDGREISAYGQPPSVRQTLPLRQGGELVGELTIGLRAGESRLAQPDEKVLVLLSTSLAVAVRATSLAAQLGSAREALVTAREEERRRLQRDLHDGLGPALTGVVLKADAARRLALSDPPRAAALMADVRTETSSTIDDVRRLVNALRPPALDVVGLVGALSEQATSLSRRADGAPLSVSVEAAEPLAELPAAVEVVAYRIATEALTNVSRHSTASVATVSLRTDDRALTLLVRDDGGANGASWRPGVGLTSMRERAAELGGACEAGPEATGGRVLATLPLGGRR